MSEINRWDDEGGLTEWELEDDLFEEDEFCPRCGEAFEVPGRPCVFCEYDPLYD